MVLDAFSGERNKDLSHAYLRELLECLTRMDQIYLQKHPETPLLYDSGIQYQEEPPGAEDWVDIPSILKIGWGDCEELAAWRVAELRERYGIHAECDFSSQRKDDGSYLYHIYVKLPDGRTEDPSRELGMI